MNQEFISIWGIDLPISCLEPEEVNYIKTLPIKLPKVNWIWSEMNRVWRDLKIDNRKELAQQVALVNDFYKHPIWLVNGLFTSIDQESIKHRKAIASCLINLKPKSIADFGGGFGVLATTISEMIPDAQIAIIEKYPSKLGLRQIEKCKNAFWVESLNGNQYEAIVLQDVLEHIDDPVQLVYQIVSHVPVGGHLIFANCFYPVIDCHLPATFHLRHFFNLVMRAMGLEKIEQVEKAPHATLFRVKSPPNITAARRIEMIAKALSAIVNPSFDTAFSGMQLLKTKAKRFVS